MSDSGTGLRARRIAVSLGGRQVLSSVDLDLPAGAWTAVVGPNGAGKSTLLRALAGLLPHAGEVHWLGRPLTAQPPGTLAWLAQQGETPPELEARDVVRLGRLPRHGLLGGATPADEQAVEEAVARCECAAWSSRRLSTLSGGERQRVLIARALAVGAGLLLLDEPTTHLDPPHQAAVVRLMREEAARGVAVAAVLHDLNLALAADRLVVMSRGRIAAEGPPADSAVQNALERVFEQAVQIERVGERWAVLPRLD